MDLYVQYAMLRDKINGNPQHHWTGSLCASENLEDLCNPKQKHITFNIY